MAIHLWPAWHRLGGRAVVHREYRDDAGQSDGEQGANDGDDDKEYGLNDCLHDVPRG